MAAGIFQSPATTLQQGPSHVDGVGQIGDYPGVDFNCVRNPSKNSFSLAY